MFKYRWINIDAVDGIGKTTQIDLLVKRLKENSLLVHNTRALGGDKTCDFQMAMRSVLLHPKFPQNKTKEVVELEEKMFSLCDLEGMKDAEKFLNENEKGIVIKDRAIFSHLCYAVGANDMQLADVIRIHNNLLLKEFEMARIFNAVHVLLIPDNVEFTLKRVSDRLGADEVIDKREKIDIQEKVLAAYQLLPGYSDFRSLNVIKVAVKESDTILDMEANILKALEE